MIAFSNICSHLHVEAVKKKDEFIMSLKNKIKELGERDFESKKNIIVLFLI